MANHTPKKKVEALPELIAKHRGNVSAISRAMKQPRSTVHLLIQGNPTLKSLLDDERERMVDDAEEGLNKAVKKGEGWAVCFALKTQGKGRGYIERQEITAKDGESFIPTRFEVVVINGSKRTTDQNTDK